MSLYSKGGPCRSVYNERRPCRCLYIDGGPCMSLYSKGGHVGVCAVREGNVESVQLLRVI